MTSAQYDRSLAAQLQSKAGDQWNYFQGKKLRSALQHNTIDVITGTTEWHALDQNELRLAVAGSPAADVLTSPAGNETLTLLQTENLPKPPAATPVDPGVKTALDSLDNSLPETELAALLAPVSAAVLEDALRHARARALAFDALIKPASQAIDVVEQQLARLPASAALKRDFTLARLRFNSLRYDAEARLNQAIASFYELQVRKNNSSAERHHRRSQRFFFGMLTAQAGVVISTLALAARQRNLLWSLAAGAGAVAVAFAIYVYLYV